MFPCASRVSFPVIKPSKTSGSHVYHITDALQTLQLVADHYQTGMTREAYEIVVSLVNQQQERRLQALKSLDSALQGRESSDRTINLLQ